MRNAIAPITYDEFLADRFFASLTGLRAVAVVLVVLQHFGGPQVAKLTGWLGVHVFFVLSGFLITTLLLRENDASGRVSLGSFFVRRAFRIMPVYYLVFLAMALQAFYVGGELRSQWVAATPYYLTFMNEQAGSASWQLTWTLGIEWKFYLVWPLIAFAVARSPLSRTILSALILAFLGYCWYKPALATPLYMVLMQGALLAMAMHDRRGFQVLRWLMDPRVSLVIFFGFMVVQTQAYRILTLGDAIVANIYGLAVVLLIPAILGSGIPGRILSSKPFVFLGERSYSLYLIQILVAQVCTAFLPWGGAPSIQYAVLVLLVGTAISDVLLRYVERPMIAIGHSLGVRVRGRAVV